MWCGVLSQEILLVSRRKGGKSNGGSPLSQTSVIAKGCYRKYIHVLGLS